MKRRGAGTLTAAHAGERVKLQGWVKRRRDHGAITFLDLRDRSGVVQVMVRADDHKDVAEALAAARIEWVVEVEGEVTLRAAEAVNSEMPTGEVEVIADRAEILGRAEALPFTVDGQGDSSEDTRLKYRFLDLRRPELQENLLLRNRVTFEIRRYFFERDFVDVETPILTRSTPEGARDYLVPSRIHRGSFYALPQSPQIFKQLTMVAGLERYVQIARCFRDEDLRADRQPEFTQVDVELSFATEEDIYKLIEGLFEQIFPLAGIQPQTPFRRLTYAEALDRFGSDRPDLRFALEIQDLSAGLGASGFRGFQQAVAGGGVVRGFVVPGAAAASRKQVEEWATLARKFGAAGVLALRSGAEGLAFQVKSALSQEEMEGAAQQLGLESGGLALLAAGPLKTTATALGALRVHLAEQYALIPEDRYEFLWVTDFPLVKAVEAVGTADGAGWEAMNHPFTSPQNADLDRLESDPGSVRARAYDVVLNGVELGGGSIRIHQADLQERCFKLLGIESEEARERFGFLLDALRCGAPPHGGIALGLDRLVMLMAGADSLRDVIPFPKTTSAMSLMTGAPAPVDAEQQRELGIQVTSPESRGADKQ